MEVLLDKLTCKGGDFEIGEDTWSCGHREITGRCFTGKSAPRTLRDFYDRYAFEPEHMESDFIVYDQERYSYREVWNRASAIGSYLRHEIKVRRGDRVAICMRNYPEWPIAFIAITSIGAVAVPMNSLWKSKELKYGLKDSGAKVMICDEKRYGYTEQTIRELGLIAIGVRTSVTPRNFERIVIDYRNTRMPLCHDLRTDDAAAIFYTSGTTGFPKGVVQTHRGVCNQLSTVLVVDHIRSIASPPTKVKSEQPCMICPVPLFHVTASHHIFLSSASRGAKLVLMYKWDAGQALKLIQSERPSSWTGVPTMVQDLMEHPDFDKYDTSSLKSIGGGGAPTPASQVKKTAKKFKSGSPGQGYGLTETNGGICFHNGEDYIKRPTSCGRPYSIVDVCVVKLVDGDDPKDEVGDVCLTEVSGANQVGELVIKSPLVMSHYFNKLNKTANSIVKVKGRGFGWFRTGDIARLDEENYIYIMDRAKDIIIRGGENISCAEVESAFYVHDSVMECAAFGIKDSRLGERVGVVVVPKKGHASVRKSDLIRAVRSKLANFKIPSEKDLFFSEHALPRGATGKILKRAIRDRINAELSNTRSKL